MDKENPLESQIANLPFLENLYQDYQTNPAQLDASWAPFFQQVETAEAQPAISTSPLSSQAERVLHLAEAYRYYGHLLARVNPLQMEQSSEPLPLQLENLGFKPQESAVLFPTLGLLPQTQATLNEIVAVLKKYYSQTVGVEFKKLTDPAVEVWMQQQIEAGRWERPFSREEKLEILDRLTRAELLETFLHTKHVGKKRFSLEGAESLIPLLSFAIAQGAEEGVEEVFMGMSHRGRLNVLAHILNKPILSILSDFDEDYVPVASEGMGDIRYHKGHANEKVHTYLGKTIKVSMAPNPSHLESVDPVIEGQTHAKQFLVGDEAKRERIVPLLLHGDAALAGQGIVYETLQMRQLPGFETGGTLHVVVNNQIGFTTSPQEARSTLYCTDIAHAFGAPVFHVNAEDSEMCVRVALFAWEIRQRFHCDVFIDLNCYRKYGHNEGDEPVFTQPLEYQMIRKKKSIRTLYLEQLTREGILDQDKVKRSETHVRKELQEVYAQSQQKVDQSPIGPTVKENSYSFQPIATQVDLPFLQKVAEHFSQIPADFHVHPKLEHLIRERNRAIQEDQPFDWGMAEYLAYGTLVCEGIPVRLAGQDSKRGTFSHRHALWVDQVTQQDYYPLAHLSEGQARFEVLNTFLSEAAVLGFEYGYSTVCKQGLTIWEAQFGDFANSAQVIIDQYLASGEEKWGQTSNLVLFLPHGFEGQGPEHSSARFERFLTLAGHDNMQIVNPTTPSQIFHLLRRQVKQSWHKPLIVLTPKGLLRHPACVSHLQELTHGQFYPILDDVRKPQNIRRLILCSGRIYYDLEAQREKEKCQDLAILRIEQLYPLDQETLKKLLARYAPFQDCQWVQEEPENMGAWSFISFYLKELLPQGIPLTYVGRERSATPATGFYARHKQELADLLSQVFNHEK